MNFYFRRRFINFFQIFAVLVCLPWHVAIAQGDTRPAPEIATNIVEKQAVTAKSYMVVTANPLATQAAEKILAEGGSAVDAGIAAQLVLGLVEPQSSGLGGGAFALYYDADSGRLSSWDGRETAPARAWPGMFLKHHDDRMTFDEAIAGGRAVGIPGTPALLHKLYKEYGILPADRVFEPAAKLAQEGFVISPRLAAMIAHDRGKLDQYEPARSYFYDENGAPKQEGTVLKNPDYAQTIRGFFRQGRSYFYETVAGDIIRTVKEAGSPLLQHSDFTSYEVKEREPVCGFYRAYKICSMGEPSSGGLTILQILGMLERFDLSEGPTTRNIHLIAEASRLAFADRNQYMADPDFVDTPGAALVDPAYLAKRSALISENSRAEQVFAGMPDLEGGTSHITIIDASGNILSMTTTIESAFGSKLMVNGFLLNNELTDFNFSPGTANSVAAGKRPRSSMAPTIMFDPEGEPFMALGSAGGSRIIGFVVQRIIAVIDWNMEIRQALDMDHFLARSDIIELEEGLEGMEAGLQALGHQIKIDEMSSGLTAILLSDQFVIGAADKRREGLAAGR